MSNPVYLLVTSAVRIILKQITTTIVYSGTKLIDTFTLTMLTMKYKSFTSASLSLGLITSHRFCIRESQAQYKSNQLLTRRTYPQLSDTQRHNLTVSTDCVTPLLTYLSMSFNLFTSHFTHINNLTI